MDLAPELAAMKAAIEKAYGCQAKAVSFSNVLLCSGQATK